MKIIIITFALRYNALQGIHRPTAALQKQAFRAAKATLSACKSRPFDV